MCRGKKEAEGGGERVLGIENDLLKEYFTPIKRGTDVNACHLRILSIFDQL